MSETGPIVSVLKRSRDRWRSVSALAGVMLVLFAVGEYHSDSYVKKRDEEIAARVSRIQSHMGGVRCSSRQSCDATEEIERELFQLELLLADIGYER